MRRIVLVVMLALGCLLGTTATAGADIGDIRELELDTDLFGTASSVEITGIIRCQATIEYGLWAGAAQDPADSEAFEFIEDNGPHEDSDVEGVGAFGPNFDPPVGVSDDSPCSQSLQSWDVLVQQNRDSGDFQDGDMLALVIAGTSAEDGDRGPGPFIADLLYQDDEVDFERTR